MKRAYLLTVALLSLTTAVRPESFLLKAFNYCFDGRQDTKALVFAGFMNWRNQARTNWLCKEGITLEFCTNKSGKNVIARNVTKSPVKELMNNRFFSTRLIPLYLGGRLMHYGTNYAADLIIKHDEREFEQLTKLKESAEQKD